MRIAHALVYYADSYKGGVQRYVEELIQRQKQHHDVTVFTTDQFCSKGDPSYVVRVPSFGVFMRTPFAPTFASRLRKHVKENEIDLVHFHSPNPLIDFSLLNIDVPSVVSVHNTFPERTSLNAPFLNAARFLLSKSLSKANKILVYDKQFLNPMVNNSTSSIIQDRICEIPPGVDSKFFSPKSKKSERSDDVLFVAHVRPEKGLHVLVEAMKHLPNARLVVLAKVTYFSKYFEKTIEKAKQVLGDRLVVKVEPTLEEIRDHYQSCGCVVCPSLGLESWNFVLLEAASCGAPLVRSDLDAFSWMPSSHCVVSKAGNSESLAHAVRVALSKKDHYGALSREISRDYNWEKTQQCIEKIYTEVVGKK